MSNDPLTALSTPDAVEPLRARLSADLLAAMKARDKSTIDTLRCLLAVLDNAGAQGPKVFGSSIEVPRKSLSQDEVQALMQAEIASRHAAIIEYERDGRRQDTARLRGRASPHQSVHFVIDRKEIDGVCRHTRRYRRHDQ
jgi:uncharacterized protein